MLLNCTTLQEKFCDMGSINKIDLNSDNFLAYDLTAEIWDCHTKYVTKVSFVL